MGGSLGNNPSKNNNMTRRDQVIRSWISRESSQHEYLSHVSFRGKVSTLRTPTKIRQAAREFNTIHTIRILTHSKAKTKAIPTVQPDLL